MKNSLMIYKGIHPDRIINLHNGFTKGKYVLYWMNQSMRIEYNHALAFAILKANERQLPLVVFFGLSNDYLNANLRHYHFLVSGLKEVFNDLKTRGIQVVFKLEAPYKSISPLLKDADLLVMDYGYLKTARLWRYDVLKKAIRADIDCFMVESDVVVPVKKIYDKAAYGAYILRPKLLNAYESYLEVLEIPAINHKADFLFESASYDDVNDVLDKLNVNRDIGVVDAFTPGYKYAKKMFEDFIIHKLEYYDKHNDPSLDYLSYMSIYLHFGQISSVELILMMKHAQVKKEMFEMYLEQLMVRRELAFNYVIYQEGYDQFETMTEPWAYQTMREAQEDVKPYIYDLKTIENANTHDPYFNAAMNEMRLIGYMKGYMRMYWAKKIIEWSPSFNEAYTRIIHLNNQYFLDGRDPNSYAGVAWCFGKHDRAFFYKEGLGKLRYMNDKGLLRKFNMDAYIAYVENLKIKKTSI